MRCGNSSIRLQLSRDRRALRNLTLRGKISEEIEMKMDVSAPEVQSSQSLTSSDAHALLVRVGELTRAIVDARSAAEVARLRREAEQTISQLRELLDAS